MDFGGDLDGDQCGVLWTTPTSGHCRGLVHADADTNADADAGTDTDTDATLCLPQIERIAHVAFKSAQKRRKQLTSVDKSNVLEVSQLWREVVTRVGKEYPDVELSHMCVKLGLRLWSETSARDDHWRGASVRTHDSGLRRQLWWEMVTCSSTCVKIQGSGLILESSSGDGHPLDQKCEITFHSISSYSPTA